MACLVLTWLHATLLVDHGELLSDLRGRVATRRLAMTTLLVVADCGRAAMQLVLEALSVANGLTKARLAALQLAQIVLLCLLRHLDALEVRRALITQRTRILTWKRRRLDIDLPLLVFARRITRGVMRRFHLVLAADQFSIVA